MDDPPLFAALAAVHGLPAHHHREDPVTYSDQPTSRVTEHRYGADDDPQGPPSPPLEKPSEPAMAYLNPSIAARLVTGADPRAILIDDSGTAPPATRAELVACPTCGTGVHPDRLRT